jgi:hypothetical protein
MVAISLAALLCRWDLHSIGEPGRRSHFPLPKRPTISAKPIGSLHQTGRQSVGKYKEAVGLAPP